ncbi:MAG: hypothetical protein U9O55_02250 [Patescibacteria group bacterium]|nr:hypothetical protein [Patescibacteria group bacterium]
MLLVENFIVTLFGIILISFSIARLIFIYHNKPEFKKGSIFWNYFRLISSTKYFVTNTTSELDPFKIYCDRCEKDYSRISETQSKKETLNFLGILELACYERI